MKKAGHQSGVSRRSEGFQTGVADFQVGCAIKQRNILRVRKCVIAQTWKSAPVVLLVVAAFAAAADSGVTALKSEVAAQGWIAYGARSTNGDWDLFLCRPDGSKARPFTRTPHFNEFAPQFCRDGRKLLYRRLPRGENIDGNHYGEQGELVIAHRDGSEAKALGQASEWPWASWSPDGSRIACLAVQGISFVELSSGRVERTMPRQGFFQQLTWSPDGHWLIGVANSFGTGWSVARMEVATGAMQPVSRVDSCTPDWFPDSRQVVFSWRPPGQKGNNGQGWTQLWRANADGTSRQLVYGEDGRHVYGGQVSPDGRYVLFTGNVREDGDPKNAGAPMGLMRLKDGPIIRGESGELRALHPKASTGPVLVLPAGWEPSWTFREVAPQNPSSETGTNPGALSAAQVSKPALAPAFKSAPATGARPAEVETRATILASSIPASRHSTNAVAAMAHELRDQGWLVFSAKTDAGDWDLFRMRPNGSDRRRLTDTREFNEAGARFSPDGARLLYYRMPRNEPVDNNTYGTFDLVLAKADASAPVVYGDRFQWASWGPDGRQLACLAPKGIQILDVARRAVVRQFPRKGIVSQLVWSPDGTRFVGTANGLGQFWNIGCLNPDTGELKAVSETVRYNCTPDWLPDSRRVVYARGIIPQQPGHAELWAANIDGTERRALYAEAGRHIYGACGSPDGKYVLFTRSIEDLGKVAEIEMAIIRWSDTPMVGANHETREQRFPEARTGPRLDLGPGWEPHWTLVDVKATDQGTQK